MGFLKEIETLDALCLRYPGIAGAREAIEAAADLITAAYRDGKTVYTCGNGGSAADADHIVGELMKGFVKSRPLPDSDREALKAMFPEDAERMVKGLQCGLPAFSLHSQSALLTAFLNDVEPAMVYAQMLYAAGRAGDVLIAISTSGNSENVLNAAKIARLKGMRVIAMVGRNACLLDGVADAVIHVDDTETYRVQELHLPIYHWLCERVEETFFME